MFRKFNDTFYLGAFLVGIMVIMAVIGPHLNDYGYEQTQLSLKNQSPNTTFWFGTDDLGRDIFTRVWIGARISLFIAIAAAVIDMIIGILWGGIAALAGGKIDNTLMRLADILFALPYVLVVILLTVLIGPGLKSIIIAMSAIGWITMARIIRGRFLFLKQQDFILSARVLGAGFFRILFRHLLPNTYGTIVVTLTVTIPSAIFTESLLSFLGLGVPPPLASWGTMVSEGIPALQYYPWRLFFPAFFISLTMLSFNLLGDGYERFSKEFSTQSTVRRNEESGEGVT